MTTPFAFTLACSNDFEKRFCLSLFRLPILVIVAALALSACGDGGDGSAQAAAQSQTSKGGNDGGSDGSGGSSSESLTVSGDPPEQAMKGQSYSFTPNVSNPGGGSLTFSASSLPSWISLDTSTGRLSGTPDASDVGTHSGISLTVSNGTDSVTVGPFSIEVVGTASGSVTLSWEPPTQETDGSPLEDLAGYKIYWGTDPDALSNSTTLENPGLTSYVVDELTRATWYFAATAYNSDGVESRFSNIASKTVM